MRKIVDYQVVKSEAPTNLGPKIVALINDGWEPYLGLAISSVGNGSNKSTIYAQAMVKYQTVS